MLGAHPAPAFLLDQLAAVDDADLRACGERHAGISGTRQRISLDVIDRNGVHDTSVATLAWRRFDDGHARVLVRMSAPPARAGVGLLMIEGTAQPQLYLYLPELRRTRRITGQALAGSMLGTDFSYEDFAAFQGLAPATGVRRLDDAVLGERDVWRFEMVGAARAGGYQRVVTWLDPATCVPLRMEFFAAAGEPAKVLEVDMASIAPAGALALPRRAVMFDRRHGSRTELVVEELDLAAPSEHALGLPALQGGQ
ncbi:MAG: outer membrane lipoprotein-sorting protein [Gammaproteobacteria bacterium]